MKFATFTDPHLDAYKGKQEEFRLFIRKIKDLVDGFICSGDWCSRNVEELEEIFNIIREETAKPVLTIFGNHDFWNPSQKLSLDEVIFLQEELCKKYNITHLENTPFETDDLFICGFDGWYAQDTGTSVTVDYDFIPKMNSYGTSPFLFLKRKEMNAIYKAIDYDKPNKKKVCVTHFGFGGTEAIKDELAAMGSDMAINSVVVPNSQTMDQELDADGNPIPDQERNYEKYNAHKRHAIILAEKFDLVIFGHSHRITEYSIGDCKFINVGAHYNQSPENFYRIIEL